MANIVQNNLLRLDKATRYREKSKLIEKGIKKTRNIFGALFLFNTLVLLALKIFPEYVVRLIGSIKYINSILPTAGFFVFIFVILSFAWLVASILKSFHAEKITSDARQKEIEIAQSLNRLSNLAQYN